MDCPPRWRFPLIPLTLATALASLILVPPISNDERLIWSVLGAASVIVIWSVILAVVGRRRGQEFKFEYVPVRSHWVQACVQFGIMLYWGWFWRDVYAEMPLMLAQLVYFYALDALLAWSRGRVWRVGFGPMPIVISTNLLLWFRHDVYFLQFAMLTTGALAKQFITWERDGRRTHIFNPSAFGQFLFAVVLIATGTTNELTVGKEIAATFDPPHMLLVILVGGLLVQSLFHVTLTTVAGTVLIVVLNLIYTKMTGLYFFVNVNIAGPIFLGLHLLITDPATSPRTNLGKVIFGALYGAAYFALFRILDLMEVPIFWDKLLPVPILNLMVPMIDRYVRVGFVGRLNAAWEGAMRPASLNVLHMSCWVAFVAILWGARYIDAPHPGDSIPFWKKAYAEGRPHAGHALVMAAGGQAIAGESGAAYNELGLICMEGKIVQPSHANAARYFAKACELRDECGCVNVAIQYLFLNERVSDESVELALEMLERDCEMGGSGRSCYLAGMAYATGRGRPFEPQKAVDLFMQCGPTNIYAAKALARIAIQEEVITFDLRTVIQTLVEAGRQGDAECCWYLAYLYHKGIGLRQSDEKARAFLETACRYGSTEACAALVMPEIPLYRNPVMSVPGWATQFPLEPEVTPEVDSTRASAASPERDAAGLALRGGSAGRSR